MGWLSSFLHPEKGYQKGQEQLNNYYGQSQGYLNPYNQQGQAQYGNLTSYIQSLMDPETLQNKWSEGYSESPEARQAEAMANEHGANAASTMGLMGSNTALNATQAGTTQIGLNDRQNYLNDLMQKYMQGAGLTQGIYNQGANAATGMSNNANQMGQNSAMMSYGEQNAGGSLLGSLLGAGIGGFGSALGGWKLRG